WRSYEDVKIEKPCGNRERRGRQFRNASCFPEFTCMEIAKRELLSKIYVRVNRESRTKIAAYVDVSRDLPMNSSMISARRAVRGPAPAAGRSGRRHRRRGRRCSSSSPTGGPG